MNLYDKGTIVYSRDRKFKGRMTGSERPCTMESCQGKRVGVRWEDGKLSFPCTRCGMVYYKNKTWRIV